MALSAEALKLRRNHVCASDTPQIMGASPWGGPLKVYDSKVNEIDGQGNEATSAGELLEEPTRQWFEMETGKRVIRPFRLQNHGFYVHPQDGLFAATLDGLVAGAPEIVEAKTTGVVGPGRNLDAWGESGSDEVPDQYMLQAQHQMYVMGETFKVVWMPVLIGTVGWRLYRIERHEGLIEDIREQGHDFWDRFVKKGIRPVGQREYDVLTRLTRVPGKLVQVDDAVTLKAKAARDARLLAEKAEQAAIGELLDAMGDAECAESPSILFRYPVESAGTRINTEILKTEFPQVYEKVRYDATRKMPRFKDKTKKGK